MRARKETPSGATDFFYLPDGTMLTEKDASATKEYLYVYVAGRRIGVVDAAGRLLAVMSDHLDTPWAWRVARSAPA